MGTLLLYNELLNNIVRYYQELEEASKQESKEGEEAQYWKKKLEKYLHICQQQQESGA